MIPLDQIINECKQYNSFAQKLLYERYAPSMKGICFRYINDQDLTKDILQEGFIKVFTNIRQYKGNGSFDGWIKRIFINTSISHLRKHKSHRFLQLENLQETEISEDNQNNSIADKEDTEMHGFQLALSADFSEDELVKILMKLPEKYRLVFVLFCIEDYSHEEIAETIGIDIATSRTRLMRARNLIKKELYKISIEKLRFPDVNEYR